MPFSKIPLDFHSTTKFYCLVLSNTYSLDEMLDNFVHHFLQANILLLHSLW